MLFLFIDHDPLPGAAVAGGSSRCWRSATGSSSGAWKRPWGAWPRWGKGMGRYGRFKMVDIHVYIYRCMYIYVYVYIYIIYICILYIYIYICILYIYIYIHIHMFLRWCLIFMGLQTAWSYTSLGMSWSIGDHQRRSSNDRVCSSLVRFTQGCWMGCWGLLGLSRNDDEMDHSRKFPTFSTHQLNIDPLHTYSPYKHAYS